MKIEGVVDVKASYPGPKFVPKVEFEYEGSVYVPNMQYSAKKVSYELLLKWASEGKVLVKEA